MEAVNDRISARRAELGMSERIVAKRVGLSVNEYLDLEMHKREAWDVVHLRTMRKVCKVLGLDLLGLFNISCAYCATNSRAGASASIQRNEVIRARRMALQMSQEELADRIGFETIAVVEMEHDPERLEMWPIQLIVDLASVLQVPVQVLLGVKCRRCGR